jgi:hypothetical protein
MQPLWQLIGPTVVREGEPRGVLFYFLIQKIPRRRTQPALAKGSESKHARSTVLVRRRHRKKDGLRFALTVNEVDVGKFRL